MINSFVNEDYTIGIDAIMYRVGCLFECPRVCITEYSIQFSLNSSQNRNVCTLNGKELI